MSSALFYDPNSTPVSGRVTRFLSSVDLPPTEPNSISNPNLSQVADVSDYNKWKVVNGEVVLLTAQDQAAIDAALAAALLVGERTDAIAILNGPDGYGKLQRCVADIVKDEINILRQQWEVSFKTQVAASTTLADFKTRMAAMPSLPDRTLSQIKTAISNRITAGDND